MSISALTTGQVLSQSGSLARENEVTETKPDNNEANEARSSQLSLKEGQGTKIDLKA